VSRQSWMVVRAVLIAAVTVFPICVGAQAGQSGASPSQAQDNEIYRRAKVKVEPVYPELARKMGISGAVKVEVTVSPNGAVKSARVVGGHPVLAGAALDAAKRWRFEPAPAESTGVIEFKFQGDH